jgi:hypothetical protein
MLEARLVRDYCPLGRFGNLATAGRPGAFLVYGLKARIDPAKLQACGKRPLKAALRGRG